MFQKQKISKANLKYVVLAFWFWMDQIWMKNAYVFMIILANFGVSEEKT